MTGSTAQILRDLVDVLRATDAGIAVLGEMLEQVPPTTERAQGDLVIIAAWLDEHPDVDGSDLRSRRARLMAGAADGSDLLARFDELVAAYRVPTSQRTGRILLTRRELAALREDLAAAGSDLTPEEIVDLMARSYGFRDGRLELYEDGSPIEP